MNADRLIGWLLRLYVLGALLFIFAPIVASFVFSFNSDRFPSLPLGHFTTEWYGVTFTDPLVLQGFRNSLLVGVTAAFFATTLGFGAAYVDYRFNFLGKKLYLALALLPPTIPVNPLRAFAVGDSVSFVVPEDRVRILPKPDMTGENCLPVRVIGEEFVGANMRLYAEADSQQEIRLLTSHDSRSGLAYRPDRVALTWDPDDAYVLPD